MLSYAAAGVSSASQPPCRRCGPRGWLLHSERLLSVGCMGWCLQAALQEDRKSIICLTGVASGFYVGHFLVGGEVSSASRPTCRWCDHRGLLLHSERLLSSSFMGWCLQAAFWEDKKSTMIAYAGGASGIYLANFVIDRFESRAAYKVLIYAGGILSAAGVTWCLHVAFVEHPKAAVKAGLAGALGMCLVKRVVKRDPSSETPPVLTTPTKSERSSRIPDACHSSSPVHPSEITYRIMEVGRELKRMADESHRRKSSRQVETTSKSSVETSQEKIPSVNRKYSSSPVLVGMRPSQVKKAGKDMNRIAADIYGSKSPLYRSVSKLIEPPTLASPVETPSQTMVFPVTSPMVSPEDPQFQTPFQTPLQTPDEGETTWGNVPDVSLLFPEQLRWIRQAAKLLIMFADELERRMFAAAAEETRDI